MLPARRIYTVPPGRPFLTALAEALLAGNLPAPGGTRPDPLQLADVTLLLPTRRATRALQEASSRRRGGAALLLPKIRPIFGAGEDAGALRQRRTTWPAARARRRRPSARSSGSWLLAKLVLRWSEAERGGAGRGGHRPYAGRRPHARRRRPPGWRASSPA